MPGLVDSLVPAGSVVCSTSSSASSNRAVAIDLATGRQAWSASNVIPWAAGDGRIYAVDVRSGGTGVAALDQTSGREVWRQPAFMTEMVVPSLTYKDGAVYAGVELGGEVALVAWDAATGRQRWTVPSRSKSVLGTIVADGVVYIGRTRGDVLAVHAESGAQLWDATVGSTLGNQLATTNGVLAGGGFGMAVSSQGVWGLDAASGRPLWKSSSSPTLDVVAADGLVFVSGVESILALDARTGRTVWQYRLPLKVPGVALITSADGVVYASAHGSVYAWAAGTGKLLWHTGLGKAVTQIVVTGDTLLVAITAGVDGPGALHAWRL